MSAIRLEPWDPDDLSLLEQTMGDPVMTEHLGGPETPEKLVERQEKYAKLADSGMGRMFKIVDVESGQSIGSVGYWDRTLPNGDEVYEIGWSVIPSFQGRGIAKEATRLALEAARTDGEHRYVHAYPSITNLPSNGICRSLGFELLEESKFEFPPGNWLTCNDWRFDLEAT